MLDPLDNELNMLSDLENWLTIEKCPSCNYSDSTNRGKLPISYYSFARQKINIESQNISVVECDKCGLLYKNKVPETKFLSQIISHQSNNIWSYDYDYKNEIELINNLLGRKTCYDLLDIGAANGDLLKHSAKLGGRRSALDVTCYPDLETQGDGEFIQGFLDDVSLSWSLDRYDIVTLFDVFEHLYNPVNAFANLSRLVKENGFVIIETGDSDKYWYKQEKIAFWQYLRLFEHHMVWNRKSLEFQAKSNGFKVVTYENKRNKYLESITIKKKINNLAMLGLYFTSKRGYKMIGKIVGKTGTQPINLFAKDHFRVVLQKTGNITQ